MPGHEIRGGGKVDAHTFMLVRGAPGVLKKSVSG
jgi:hypothetical protein